MKTNIGKENAKKVFNKKQNRWDVYWFDPDGTRHNSTYAKWWWEVNRGDIPDGYRASYLDNNSLNIEPENIIILSSDQFGNKISRLLMGHTFSEETLRKMSEAKKGKPLSEQHKIKIGIVTKRHWEEGIFDTIEIRNAYAEQGRSTKGSKRTPEQRKKLSEIRKANPVISQMFTPEAIEKRRQKLLGKSQTPESNQKRSLSQKGKKVSVETRVKLSQANRKNIEAGTHNFWRGGVTSDPYPPEFGDLLRGKIRRRDGHVCQSCGTNVYRSIRGHVHHIDGDKQNCDESNLILLCATCHNAVHQRNPLRSEKIIELQSRLKY